MDIVGGLFDCRYQLGYYTSDLQRPAPDDLQGNSGYSFGKGDAVHLTGGGQWRTRMVGSIRKACLPYDPATKDKVVGITPGEVLRTAHALV